METNNIFNFLNTSVTTAENIFSIYLNTPKSRSNKTLAAEVFDIKQQILSAYQTDDITEKEYKDLMKRINKVDFSKISEIRRKEQNKISSSFGRR